MVSHLFKQKIVAGFIWQSGSKFIIQIFTWAATILVARMLEPEDYGIVAIQGIFTVTVNMLVDMGVSQGLIQKKSVTDEEIDSLFYFSFLIGVTAFAIYYFTAPIIASFYDIPELTAILRVAGITFILGSLKSVSVAVTMRDMNFRYRSLVEMGGAFVNSVSVLTMAFMGLGVWALILGPLISYSVTTIAYFPILGRVPQPRLVMAEIAGVLRFGFKVMLPRLLYSVYMRADVFFLGKVGGERLTGIYSMATELASIPLNKIGTIFNEVAFPAISRVQSDASQVKALFLAMHKYLLMVSLPMLIGIAMIAPEFVRLALGEKWLAIVEPLQIFALINVLRLSAMIMVPVLQGFGYPGAVLRYSAWCTLLLPCAFFVGSRYGVRGVMIAWVLAFPLVYSYLVAQVLDAIGISFKEFFKTALKPSVCTSFMAGTLFMFYTAANGVHGWGYLFSSVAVGGASYVIAYIVIFRNEVNNFMSMIKQLRKPAII